MNITATPIVMTASTVALRPYQTEAVELLRNSMRKNKRIVLCLPTGAGKSVIFSDLVRRIAQKQKRTLVLTHRIELFTSTFSHLERNNIIPEVIQAGSPDPNPFSSVIVAMVETLNNRIKKGLQLYPDVIIIDEAHFGNFSKTIDLFPDAFIVGVTATPVGKHFHKYYTDIVANIDIPELVEQGYLAPCIPYQMEDDFSDVKIASTGEFEDASLYAHFNKRKLYDGVVDEYEKLLVGKKTLVFNVNIEHTLEMTRTFTLRGHDARYVTSKTPMKEREAILAAFSLGEFPILNNCGILTTGYDEPSIEAIIMNRATLSLPLWLQCQGRGSRTFPGKTHFTVIDFGCNHDRHGLWSEKREWSLKEKKKRQMLDASPVKRCPACSAIIHPSQKECPHCGYVFPEKEEELVNGKAVLQMPGEGRKYISTMSIDELIKCQTRKKISSKMVWRVIRSRGEEDIECYARLMGYKSGWVKFQIEDMGDSKYKDMLISL